MPTYRVAANSYAVHQLHRYSVGTHTGGAANSAGTSYGLEGTRPWIINRKHRESYRQAFIGIAASPVEKLVRRVTPRVREVSMARGYFV